MRNTARTIIISPENKLILIKRTRAGMVYYVTPGGGIEPGESPEQAAIREAHEETGSDWPLRRSFLRQKME